METLATATATQTLQRTMRSTSVLPRVIETSTNVITLPVVVTAAAPRVTETSWNIRTVQSCPPNTVSTWLCVHVCSLERDSADQISLQLP